MAKGKQTCKILKEIRKQIAAEDDIELVVSECTYQGDCKGTCPKCEAEVRYLERELEKRQRMGKAAVFAGLLLGTLFAAASCGHFVSQPQEGDPVEITGLDDLGWNEDETEDGEYQDVDEMPEFPGGEEKMMEFIQKYIKYPKEAVDAGTQGRVVVGFVIEKDGSIGDVKLQRGIGHGCNEEALRVVQSMPKWKPGKNDGEPVEVSFLLPIDFKLE